MTDIFVSYAREDRGRVKTLIKELADDQEFNIWYDVFIEGGSSWRDSIRTRLKEAKVCLVIWSRTSILKPFVIEEASQALAEKKLIPVLLDGLTGDDQPLGFRELQAIPFDEPSAIRTALGRYGVHPLKPKVVVTRSKSFPNLSMEFGKLLRAHSDTVRTVKFGPNSDILYSASSDMLIFQWSLKDGRQIGTLKGHNDRATCMALARRRQIILSGGRDNALILWGLDAKQRATLRHHADWVKGVAVSADENWGFSIGRDGLVFRFSLDDPQTATKIANVGSNLNGIATAPDGRHIAVATKDATIRLIPLAIQAPELILHGHGGEVETVEFVTDSQVASGGRDHVVRIWNRRTGELEFILRGHTGAVRALAVSRDGKLLASGGEDNQIFVWSMTDRTHIAELTAHTSTVRSLAFSDDGQLLVSAGADNKIRTWHIGRKNWLGRSVFNKTS